MGVEALLRWQDPNGGLIPPGEFIPLAEEMGLIETIGEWVVEELAQQDRLWRRDGLDLEISFNLSPRQLRQPHVGERLLALLDGSGVDPRNVVVEITESTAMTDPDRTLRTLRDLHSRGLRLAIDDFGTGYSSLARLRDMPVEILKIDRSFVRGVTTDADAGSMVRAIIQLAEGLGKVPLAEGIETEEEWRFLVENGHISGGIKPAPELSEFGIKQIGRGEAAIRPPALGYAQQLRFAGKVVEAIKALDSTP